MSQIRSQFLRIQDVCQFLKVSPRTVDRWEQYQGFPKRRVLGSKIVVWLEEEILAWVRSSQIKNKKIVNHAINAPSTNISLLQMESINED